MIFLVSFFYITRPRHFNGGVYAFYIHCKQPTDIHHPSLSESECRGATRDFGSHESIIDVSTPPPQRPSTDIQERRGSLIAYSSCIYVL